MLNFHVKKRGIIEAHLAVNLSLMLFTWFALKGKKSDSVCYIGIHDICIF